jgi:hypothetical protein
MWELQRAAIVVVCDSVDSPVPQRVAAIEITDAQWQTCSSNPGWTVANGALVTPLAPTPADILAADQASQIAALTSSYQGAIQQLVSFTTAAGVTKSFQADTSSQNVLVIAATGYDLLMQRRPASIGFRATPRRLHSRAMT